MSATPDAPSTVAAALRSSYALLQAVLAVLAVAYLASGIYVVGSHEVAIELRCGRIVGGPAERLNRAGVHIAWPAPVGEVLRVEVGRLQTESTDTFWYAPTAQEQRTGAPSPAPAALRPGVDGYLLLADGGVVHAKWTVTYRVTDPDRYLFAATEPRAVLKALFENAIGRVATTRRTDAVLRDDQESMRRDVLAQLTALLREVDLGIEPEDVLLTEAAPPRQVADAFDESLRAEQEGRRLADGAQVEASKIIADAQAQAQQTVATAKAAKENHVKALAAEAKVFTELLPSYQANPLVFTRDRWARGIAAAVKGCERCIAVKDPDELRLLLAPPRVGAEKVGP